MGINASKNIDEIHPGLSPGANLELSKPAAAGADSATPLIRLDNIEKTYPMGDVDVHALRGVDLKIMTGEMLAIVGPSGSGKSTLMNIIGCMDQPSEGAYYLDGQDVSRLDVKTLARIRNEKLGFVFQRYNLLARTSARYNVQLPLFYAGQSGPQVRQKALDALTLVGLAGHAHHRPNQMSGGQQQRVAIARAMVHSPLVILADEPTGALDTVSSNEIMEIFRRMNREQGVTVIIITHESDIARYCQRQIHIRDGRIVDDAPVSDPVPFVLQGI